eukprot:2431049-Prymnesium_polylepis.1
MCIRDSSTSIAILAIAKPIAILRAAAAVAVSCQRRLQPTLHRGAPRVKDRILLRSAAALGGAAAAVSCRRDSEHRLEAHLCARGRAREGPGKGGCSGRAARRGALAGRGGVVWAPSRGGAHANQSF